MKNNYAEINGVTVDVTTVMDKTVEYHPTPKEAKNIVYNAWNLLDKYFPNHLDDGEGLWTMFGLDGVFWNNKGWIISAMQKHPQYNGNYQIVLRDVDMCRHIDTEQVHKFLRYAESILEAQTIIINQHTGEIISEEELEQRRNARKVKFALAREMRDRILAALSRNGNENRVQKEEKLYEIYWNFRERITNELYEWETELKFQKEYNAICAICAFIKTEKVHIVSDKLETRINTLFSDDRFTKAGQKISRLVGKIAKKCGLDKHTDIRTETFYTQDGEERTRTKDYGYNYMFAQFADAINPITVKATAVISVNPIDFYTMSFGDTWASCHTIDKNNRRGKSNGYGGAYCSGTESYLLDRSSVVFYFIPNTTKNTIESNNPELFDKVKRCMFYLGEDKLIQSRVYPDGRDGGEESLAGDIRAIMQKVIADIFEVPNFWKYIGGTEECNKVTESYGTHYKDYLYYDDCGVCYLKRIDGYLNRELVEIGCDPICPECGNTHDESDNIFCYNHQHDYDEYEEDEDEDEWDGENDEEEEN